MCPLVDLHAVIESHLFLGELVLKHARKDLEQEEPVEHAQDKDENGGIGVVRQTLEFAVVWSDQRTEEHEQ